LVDSIDNKLLEVLWSFWVDVVPLIVRAGGDLNAHILHTPHDEDADSTGMGHAFARVHIC
jgi:hypothetical protein